MALFGKADEHLPILTKLYQLEFDKYTGEGDLEAFMISFLEGEGAERGTVPPLPENINERESILRRIGQFVALIQRVMDSAADKTEPSVEDEFEINELFDTFVKPEMRFTANGWQVFHPLAMFPDLDMIADYKHWHVVLKRLSLAVLFQTIDKGSFARCSLCGSVYQRLQRTQKYCSDRCHSRAGSRRYYERKRDALLRKS